MLATPKLQSGDPAPYGTISAITPNVAYNHDGVRVEVFSAAGSLDGQKADWRAVNAYAYLVNSVPKGKHLYSTVYNALYDSRTVKKDSAGDWQVIDAAGAQLATSSIFKPTLAFQKQINQYNTATEAREYVNVLGAKASMVDSYNAPGSLARLLKDAGVMSYCSSTKTGACITESSDDADALMHSKYALFEQAADSTGKVWDNVVFVTSANLNGASGGKKANTAIAVYGDSAGYSGLLNGVWKAQLAEKETTAYKAAMANGVSSDDSDIKYFPSPRKTDFEAQTLKAAAAVSGKTECKASLAHSLFSEARSALLTQLSALQSQGCDVKVMLGSNAISEVVDTYFAMSTEVRETIKKVEFGEIHDKVITVSYKDAAGTPTAPPGAARPTPTAPASTSTSWPSGRSH